MIVLTHLANKSIYRTITEHYCGSVRPVHQSHTSLAENVIEGVTLGSVRLESACSDVSQNRLINC